MRNTHAVLKLLGALASYFGLSLAVSAADPFNPTSSLYPENPLTKILTLEATPKNQDLPFGRVPQFQVTIRNTSHEVVDLSGVVTNSVRLRPYICLAILRHDGRNVGYCTDLRVPAGRTVLAPSTEYQFDFPSDEAVAARDKNYRREPNVLLPGEYKFYVHLWVDHDGEPERLLSSVGEFSVVDDGSGDAKIAEAVQTGKGVTENLDFIITDRGGGDIYLQARNHGHTVVYIGDDWRLYWESSNGENQEQGGGLRSGGYGTIRPGETVQLGGYGFGKDRSRGRYRVQVRYYDYEGRLLKSSNTLRLRVDREH